MIHKFFEPGDWFAAKRVGYGAGLPVAWQGWVVLGLFLVAVFGFGLLIETGDLVFVTVGIIGFVLSTIVLSVVAKKRTRGGWKWRMGKRD